MQLNAVTQRSGEQQVPTKTRDRFTSKQIRRLFFAKLIQEMQVVVSFLSGILVVMVGSGLVVGRIESWRIGEFSLFTFVTGLTIGYGDLTPKHFLGRLLAIVIAFAGSGLSGSSQP